MNSVISEKGQVTIPKPLRDTLGLAAGTVLDFEEEEGVLIARKRVESHPIRAWRGKGALPFGKTVDAYLSGAREGA